MNASLRRICLLLLFVFLFNACHDDDKPALPSVAGISPDSGVPNDIVVVSGSNFGRSIDLTRITFNGISAIIKSVVPDKIEVLVPSGATTGQVEVTISGNVAANKPEFTIDHPESFIKQISPTTGGNNTLVTISGNNFYDIAGSNAVTVSGVAALVESASATELKVRVPLRAGSGDVIVNGVAASQRFTYVPDIYVLAQEFISNTSGYGVIWKNGVPSRLTESGTNSYPSDMAIDGSDIYISGTLSDKPVYWKNKVAFPLEADGLARAYQIFVVNGNVYCGGYALEKGNVYESMVHWKNDVIAYDSKSVPVQFNRAMAMRGEDVYIGGSESKPTLGYPAYFKDRSTTFISNAPGQIQDMVFVGSDLYAAGYTVPVSDAVACIWKNDILTNLPNDASSSVATKLKIVGDDVYVGGYARDKSNLFSLVVWKNGNPTYLTTGAATATVVGLDVLGDDVYVLSYLTLSDGSYKIVLWKNGVPSYLTDSKTAWGVAMVLQ